MTLSRKNFKNIYKTSKFLSDQYRKQKISIIIDINELLSQENIQNFNTRSEITKHEKGIIDYIKNNYDSTEYKETFSKEVLVQKLKFKILYKISTKNISDYNLEITFVFAQLNSMEKEKPEARG